MFDDLLYRVSQSPTARSICTPLARGYLRYAPGNFGKETFWLRVVDPYLAWQPHDFVASTRFGKRLAGNTTDMVQQYLYYFGLWEPDLTNWISGQLRPGDTFVDVGANIGYYSLLASALVGKTGAVVAIEASPAIFQQLERNVARNDSRNVRCANIAASDRRAKLPLFCGPEHNLGETSLYSGPGFRPAGWVNAAPLAEILAPAEIANARLMKIDVEGAEGLVLPGLVPLLDSGRSELELIVEFHPQYLTEEGRRPRELIQLLETKGFHAYRLENDYWPFSYSKRSRNKRPTRLVTPIEDETVIVFSRRDEL